jgi:hypothetical protein
MKFKDFDWQPRPPVAGITAECGPRPARRRMRDRTAAVTDATRTPPNRARIAAHIVSPHGGHGAAARAR